MHQPDLSKSALSLTVEKAVQIAKYTERDPCSGLAEERLMINEDFDLELYHPVDLDMDAGLKLLCRRKSGPMLTSGSKIQTVRVIMLTLALRFTVTHTVSMNDTPVLGTAYCVLIAGEGDDMQRDYAYTISREADKLETPSDIGIDAAKNTVSRLGARKITTQNIPVIIDRELAPGFLGHFVSAISGGSLYRKSSFLLDSLGTQLFPDWVEILERPHLKKALASSTFDNEGVATRFGYCYQWCT